MNPTEKDRHRFFSVVGFSFFFAYLLAFLFEGQILYGLLEHHGEEPVLYITITIAAHFAGLSLVGFLIRDISTARRFMLLGAGLIFLATLPFYFAPSSLWTVGLLAAGFISGGAVAAWGFYLKAFTPRNERLRSCADVLILSNLLMIALDLLAALWSPAGGLSLTLLCLPLGAVFIFILPAKERQPLTAAGAPEPEISVRLPLLLLCLFVFVITINSGLMYQVFNPAFAHLTLLTSWYWAVPDIAALIILRSLPMKVNRSKMLYVGMAMIMTAFIGFMLLGRQGRDYLIVDTLMLGACGIFDLFWWSILGEMLDFTKRPAAVFGIGLSANVLGVLCGDLLGMTITSINLPDAEVAVIALSVVCVTLVLLPPLNRQLVMLLKNHTYLLAYSAIPREQRAKIVHCLEPLDPLTPREEEVLQLILDGNSNRQIAARLFVSENTVKTHIRNIFSKYGTRSRAELISTLLQDRNR